MSVNIPAAEQIDIVLVLQVLTLLVAAVGPALAYRYARKLSLSNNRQAWIDALRDDVAHFIALKESRMMTMRKLSSTPKTEIEARRQLNAFLTDRAVELQAARQRIRLRLRRGNPMHDRLIAAIEALATAKSKENRNPLRVELVTAAEDVITYTWNKVERGE